MAERKTPQSLERQRIQNEFNLAVIGRVLDFLATMTRYLAWVAVAAFAYFSIRSLAGNDTKFTADVKAIVNARADRYILLLASLLAGGAWRREYGLRKKETGKVKQLQDLLAKVKGK